MPKELSSSVWLHWASSLVAELPQTCSSEQVRTSKQESILIFCLGAKENDILQHIYPDKMVYYCTQTCWNLTISLKDKTEDILALFLLPFTHITF